MMYSWSSKSAKTQPSSPSDEAAKSFFPSLRVRSLNATCCVSSAAASERERTNGEESGRGGEREGERERERERQSKAKAKQSERGRERVCVWPHAPGQAPRSLCAQLGRTKRGTRRRRAARRRRVSETRSPLSG